VAVSGWLARSGLWLLLAALLLLGAFVALAGGAVALGAWLRGGEPGGPQVAAWLLIVRGVALQALLPHLLLTGGAWAVLARAAPRLDASWPRLALGLALLATLAFPPVARLSFAMWTPGSWVDVFHTLWLMAGGVTAALLLARRLAGRRLAPGALASPRAPLP
jgi:hypothetical protein